MTSTSRIDEYLDELAAQLTGSAEKSRRFLAEVESHLRDDYEARRAVGADAVAAELAAIRAFGTAGQVARAENQAFWRASRASVVIASIGLALRLFAIGLMVIGVAGAAARFISNLGFVDAIYGLPSNVHMPASACAHWLVVQPTAATCQRAGTLEASDDITMVSFAIGTLGLVMGIPLLVAWFRHRAARKVLPATLGPSIAAAVFGAAAVGLFVLGITNAVLGRTWGAGMWLTDAAVALVVCAGALALLVRAMRGSYLSQSVGATG